MKTALDSAPVFEKPQPVQKEIEKAMDLVRGYQVMRFVEMADEATSKQKASMQAAEAALNKYGQQPVTLVLRLDTAVLLSSMFSHVQPFNNTQDMDMLRMNFILGVANTVYRLDPALAAIALGETKTKHHVPPTAARKSGKGKQAPES